MSRILLIALAGLPSPRVSAQPGLQPVRGAKAMVATSDAVATRVGLDILKRGGNAVDAGVAVALALAVTHPAAGNLGGGGFMLIRMNDGKTVAIDYRETAPAAAHRDLFLKPDGTPDRNAATIGHRAVGIPGTVAGLALALEKHGTLPWCDVVEPARKLAADGFPVPYGLAQGLRASSKLLDRYDDSRRIFLNAGRFHEENATLRQPDLAATLTRLKEKGPREFYEGRTAELIVADMKAQTGLITLDDLRRYAPVVREPVRRTYRGREILSMPPPSSGGIILVEMLNMLEPHDLRALGHNSSEKYHLLIEVMRRAFADRAEFLGDPGFVDIPAASLLAKDYARARAKEINPHHATPSDMISHGEPAPAESRETTHFSIVDAHGNAVANTYTLNGAYGSGATVPGAGFLLNNEMDDFTSKPGAPNLYGLIQGERNAIAPGKRPLSSMTPTIVLQDGKLLLVVGSPGGPTIINTVLQVIVNVVDHDMNIRQAVEAPRVHHQWKPDEIEFEPFGIASDVRRALEARGHRFAKRPGLLGDAECIMVDPKSGIRLGAADPRGNTSLAEGY